MRSKVFVAACMVFISAPVAAREISISGLNVTRDIACNGSDIDINGMGHKLRITGECRSLDIHGSNHTIHFEDANDLDIKGIGINVTGKQADSVDVEGTQNQLTTAIDGEDESGELDVAGSDHKVQVTLLSGVEIEVSGSNNTVEWKLAPGAEEPLVQIHGIGNNVMKISETQ